MYRSCNKLIKIKPDALVIINMRYIMLNLQKPCHRVVSGIAKIGRIEVTRKESHSLHFLKKEHCDSSDLMPMDKVKTI